MIYWVRKPLWCAGPAAPTRSCFFARSACDELVARVAPDLAAAACAPSDDAACFRTTTDRHRQLTCVLAVPDCEESQQLAAAGRAPNDVSRCFAARYRRP